MFDESLVLVWTNILGLKKEQDVKKKNLLTILDLTQEELLALLDRALEMKKTGRSKEMLLRGFTLGLLFDKASTRTRVSFESAMSRLGGQSIFLTSSQTQMARDEPLRDTARVLSRYLDCLAVRTYSQELIEEMAYWADIPVINALTDQYHPCQILSDLMTIKEKRGSLEGLRVAWIGDGNNVACSWINAARVLGFDLRLSCPHGYEPPLMGDLDGVEENITMVRDPREAAQGANIINTDVWVSMGQEPERERRLRDFEGFQVDSQLVALGGPDVMVMHCLPAHRGEEISAEVLDGPHSVVFDQAENKMHLHQALLATLI